MNFITKKILSKDGTPISYRQYGSGKGLILVHGSLRIAESLDKLAGALSNQFTVYTYDRRGRGLSGDIPGDYRIEKECDDLIALIKETKSPYIFGHSYGGLVTLETALRYPLNKIAVYEPAVSIHHSIPVNWLPAFKEALNQNKNAKAIVIFLEGLQLDDEISKLPYWLLIVIIKVLSVIKSTEIAKIIRVLPTIERELQEVIRLDSSEERYKQLNIPALFLRGMKSPDYLKNVIPRLNTLAEKSEMYSYKSLGHGAPEEKGEKIAKTLTEFYND